MTIRHCAPAKINICLHILKHREDGLHQIESLVTFLDCGEWITLSKANKTELNIVGPQAKKLPVCENNLILRATRLFLDALARSRFTKACPLQLVLEVGARMLLPP
jgi:4-diphosphocytidyl-2-C-methyl-D-erythritol kinase